MPIDQGPDLINLLEFRSARIQATTLKPLKHIHVLISFFTNCVFSGKYNLKPILVDNSFHDDLLTEELELLFGYKTGYTSLTNEDAKTIISAVRHQIPVDDLENWLNSRKEKSKLSRTQRVKHLGLGFNIQSFTVLLKPLKLCFK